MPTHRSARSLGAWLAAEGLSLPESEALLGSPLSWEEVWELELLSGSSQPPPACPGWGLRTVRDGTGGEIGGPLTCLIHPSRGAWTRKPREGPELQINTGHEVMWDRAGHPSRAWLRVGTAGWDACLGHACPQASSRRPSGAGHPRPEGRWPMAGGAGPDRPALSSQGVLMLSFQPAELPEASARGRGADHPDACPTDVPAPRPAL